MAVINDRPIISEKDDYLSMQKQIKGFAKYIRSCDTPITISIQGKWGSGKTSFFELLRSHMCKEMEADSSLTKCEFVTFNAWQYSQFNNEGNLPATLLASLVKKIEAISPKDEDGQKLARKTLSGIKLACSVVTYAGNEFLKNKLGVDVMETVSDIKDINDDFYSFVNVDAVSSLQADFNKCVDHCLKGKGPNARLVVFIDDLDRLMPEKAVELLEVMKIFLDSPKCVFLLAIDYDVVINGVMAKYKNTISAEKGKDYFEKMIQVVYRLPGAMSHMTKYLESLFSKDEYGLSRTCAYEFSDLLSAAQKDNPRGVKRLINNYLLTRSIGIESELYKEPGHNSDICLFAFTCLLEMCPSIYNRFCQNIWEQEKLITFMNDLYRWEKASGKDTAAVFADGSITELIEDKNSSFLKTFIHILYNVTPYSGGPEVYSESNIGHVVTALRVLNYNEEESTCISKVCVYPTDIVMNYLLDYDYCEDPDDVIYTKLTSKGTVEDAYAVSLSLILNMYDADEQRRLRQDISFFYENNDGDKYRIEADKTAIFVYRQSDQEYGQNLSNLTQKLPVVIEWYKRADDRQPCMRFEYETDTPDLSYEFSCMRQ